MLMNTKGGPYGAVEHNGKTLTITQQPYPAGTSDDPVYEAAAEDDDGNEYRVTWQVTNPDAEDASDAANWDRYSVDGR